MTIAGTDGATYQFEAGACLGNKSPSGRLVLTAEGTGSAKAGLIVTFDGDGKANVLLTAGEDATAVVWSAETPVGATASRTLDTIKIVDMPISQLTGVKGTANGFLKCENTDGLL
ncbi:hypothetical protein [Kitasatospora sp. NPDC093102]|uniref:hypothetical protein n=1 Tax=Kitasatospora sp. NPDC093102 TaxID=3155069 RepID=UPI003445BA40